MKNQFVFNFIEAAADSRGARDVHALLFFAITYFFCNNFEELQTELFKVELIVNNAPLTYVCPNMIETCLTSNHWLIDRQFLYSSNTTPITIVKNLTFLSSTADKINRMTNNFLHRWKHEYVVNLRETQRTSKLNIILLKINVNDIVLVSYEKVPRHFWRIVIVTRVLLSRDSEKKRRNSENCEDQYNLQASRK